MSVRVTGRFYFRKTSNGNLLGEWSNSHEMRAFSESADLVKAGGENFLGDYVSTWQESNTSIRADLTISKKGSGPLFTLKWRGTSEFDGEGMLCDDILIGDYHSVAT